MKKEAIFLKECIAIYLGKPSPGNLAGLFCRTDASKINELASRHRLNTLLYYLHEKGAFEVISFPDEMVRQWKTVSWKNSFENQLKDSNAHNILGEIEKKNINYIYLKGKAVRQYHREDYITSSTDLDLFINKESYAKLKTLLLENGYTIPDPGKMMEDTVLTTSEFEDSMNEIMFVKKEKTMSYIIDIQWDFISLGTKSPLHKIYEINDFIIKNRIKMQNGENFSVYTLPMEKQFFIMAFHHAIHHGFRGLKWFVDMGIYYVSCKPDISILCDSLSQDSRKIIGIAITLIREFAGMEKPDYETKKLMCTDRLLPFEYSFYRARLMESGTGLWNNISHRIVKVLLPYSHRNKLKVLAYLLFNPDSIVHRVESEKSHRGIGNLFSIFRVIIENTRRKRRKPGE